MFKESQMWSLAAAKQQFSEVVRLAEHTPQPIMRHHKEVAVLISARDFEDFKAWQATNPSLKFYPDSSTELNRQQLALK